MMSKVTYEKAGDNYYRVVTIKQRFYGGSFATFSFSNKITKEEYDESTRKDKV